MCITLSIKNKELNEQLAVHQQRIAKELMELFNRYQQATEKKKMKRLTTTEHNFEIFLKEIRKLK